VYLLVALVVGVLFIACQNPITDPGDSGGESDTAATYTITYDANGATGGDVPTDDSEYESGVSATVLDNTGALVKDGYRFTGWNTAADASGDSYQAGDTLTIDGASVTLYAQWVALGEYTVSYNANGADGGSPPAAQTKIEGTDLTLATNSGGLTKTGHTFVGWNTADDGSGTVYAEGATYTDDADLALYAQWQINSYTVTFNSNGGSNVTSQTVDYGGTITEPAAPTKTGETFGGWFTDDGTFASAWDFVNDTVSGDLTLHAQFAPDIAQILASDGAADDYFGYSVSISGDYAIVGAHYDDDNGFASGSAYIFRRTGTNSWDAGTKITAADNAAGDGFGNSVSISGDYAIVGARSDDDNGSNSGSAYIFRRTGTNSWDAGTKITASDGAADDRFGASVSISGDYAIVGARGDDDNGSNSGSAYIFRRTGTNSWDAGTKIIPSDGSASEFDYFGSSVSISGDYAIVGAYGDASGSGSAYIFQRTGPTGTNSWDAGTNITPWFVSIGSEFGSSVSISGDYAIVGAQNDDDNGTDSGSAYIFQRTGPTGINSWDAGTKITASDGAPDDRFGVSVSISGDYAIVGAWDDDDNGSFSGSAYIFRRTGTNSWDAGTKITASDGAAGDRFGYSVSISGDYAIVGAWYDDDNGSNSGSAYIFRRTGSNSWDAEITP
jgi:uncharacterized repeat protein (TIGR02543 family)